MVGKNKRYFPLLILIIIFISTLFYPTNVKNKTLVVFGNKECLSSICSKIESKVTKIESDDQIILTFSNAQKVKFCISEIEIPRYLVNEYPELFYVDSLFKVNPKKPFFQIGDSVIKKSGDHKFQLKRGQNLWEFRIRQRYYNPCID